jgi:hypothetical protein
MKPVISLSEKYQRLYNNLYFDVHDGWHDILNELSPVVEREFKKIQEETGDVPEVLQIKEKFGGLRYYVSHSSDELDGAIRDAEHRSFRTCEFCGEPGQIGRLGARRSDPNPKKWGWAKTMCEKCEDEQARAKLEERW